MEDLNLFKDYINKLHENYGPDPNDFDGILDFVNKIKPEEIGFFREQMQPILNPNTIIGFSYTKPFGYNGDFFIIEKIYQHYITPDEKYRKWDQFFHRLPAAIAVVNRKKLAKKIFREYQSNSNGNKKTVFILGSGPVTEVFEYLTENPDSPLVFDLLDLDNRAIQYAKVKTKQFSHKLTFYNKNVIRHTPEKTYDLIWSAGLFDYFKDKHFVFLLKKYYQYLSDNGEIIIGNFNLENPSRKIMEILGDWFLYHRSKDELLKFASQAGIPAEKVEVISEPLGINLFLRVKK
jgi:SAM-dependent methyltransferase